MEFVFKELHPIDEKTGKLINPKIKFFLVFNKEANPPLSHIGEIMFDNNEYIFFPSNKSSFTKQELRDIANFCEEQTEIYLDTL